MRMALANCVVATLLLLSSSFGQGVPFDQCGTVVFIDVEGGCWKFLADDGNGYEFFGNVGDLTPGERLRFIGHYKPMYSICMVGMCCVLVDTAMPCVSCCEDRGNADGVDDGYGPINVSDITYLVSYIFHGGPAPPCTEEGDVNGDGSINIADVVHLVQYIFFGGPPPAPCP